MDNRPPNRSMPSALSKGMYWAQRCTSIAMQFAAPPAIGYWIDNRYGLSPIAVSLGGLVGFVGGFRELLRLVKQMDAAEQRESRK